MEAAEDHNLFGRDSRGEELLDRAENIPRLSFRKDAFGATIGIQRDRILVAVGGKDLFGTLFAVERDQMRGGIDNVLDASVIGVQQRYLLRLLHWWHFWI